MTWFKVDDQLHDHKKFRKLGDDRLAACGLWTHCGSWAGDNLSDGFVPLEVVRRWDPKLRLAERLMEVGLWTHGEVDGEQGYLFHEWEDHQPTRAEVQKRRDETRERVQRWRDARAKERAEAGSTHGDTNGVSKHASNGVTHASSDAARNRDVPDPEGSRPEPDPTRTSYGSTRGGRRTARNGTKATSPPPPTPIDSARNTAPCRTHPDDDRNCRRCRDLRLERESGTQQGDLRAVAELPDDQLPVDDILGPDPEPVPLPSEREFRDDIEAYNAELARRRRERREQREHQARERLANAQAWGLR